MDVTDVAVDHGDAGLLQIGDVRERLRRHDRREAGEARARRRDEAAVELVPEQVDEVPAASVTA